MSGDRGRSGAWKAVRSRARSWRKRRSVPLSLAVIAGLFAAVTALRWFVDGSGQAAALLYVVPIALAALWFGRRGGIWTAAVGTAAFLVLAAVDGRGDLDATGWIGPLVAMSLVGGLIGHLVDRAGRRQPLDAVHVERDRQLEELCEAQHAALVTSDSIIQQFAAARWLLEVGRTEEAAGILGDTVADCVARLSQGLSLHGVGGDTDRGAPRAEHLGSTD